MRALVMLIVPLSIRRRSVIGSISHMTFFLTQRGDFGHLCHVLMPLSRRYRILCCSQQRQSPSVSETDFWALVTLMVPLSRRYRILCLFTNKDSLLSLRDGFWVLVMLMVPLSRC